MSGLDPNGAGVLVVGGGSSLPTAAGPVLVPLAAAESTVLTSDTALAQVRFDPADYSTPPSTITLEAVGSVVSGVTGTLTLYDLTGSASAASLAWTETSATRKTASVTVPGSAKTYELRWKKSGGGSTDYALLGSAQLRLNWS